jgi:hypothetical protein
VKLAEAQNLIDDAKVIHHLKAPGLETLALGANEITLCLIDDSEAQATSRKIASQCQSSRPSPYDQNLNILMIRSHGKHSIGNRPAREAPAQEHEEQAFSADNYSGQRTFGVNL